MKKILIVHPSLVGGGAEKVLINMLNSFDYTKYDVTLLTIIDEGINKKYLNKNVKYNYIFKHHIKGYRHFLKFFTPEFLFKKFIKNKYDTIISYLEGPTTRIISGATYPANLISWIHTENTKCFEIAFRNKNEMVKAYKKMDKIVCVSNDVKKSFDTFTNNELTNKTIMIKNINNPDIIKEKSKEKVDAIEKEAFNIVAIGRLDKNKDYARLIPMINKLKSYGININLLILGQGEEFYNIQKKIKDYNVQDNVKLLGYQDNPYKFLAKADLYICCSHYEGYSTTTVEALILNVPILTTNCSGMKDILDNGKCGIIVEDEDEAILSSIEELVHNSKLRNQLQENQRSKIKKLYRDYYNSLELIESILNAR